MRIEFATKNPRKLAEAQAGCRLFGIEVGQQLLDIEEIQSRDPSTIAIRKAEAAYSSLGPVVVNDTSWSFPALNGFPGGYMKDVAEWFSPGDFINLTKIKGNREVSFTETVVYKGKVTMKVFTQSYIGRIATSPRGSGASIEKVAEFNGKTIGEFKDEGKLLFEPRNFIWYDFAKWYSETKPT